MARMHSRKKGKHGSTKPSKKSVPSWIVYKPKEIELLIVKLAKKGLTASQIGIFLRDSYGIPDVQLITKKKITQILNEKEIAPKIPEDLNDLMKRAVLLRKHLEINRHDMSAKRGLQLTESKIQRLIKYYKNSGKLSRAWKLDLSKVTV